MNMFEDELKNGRFVVPECPRCQKTVWPPAEFCSRCFGNVVWRTVSDAGTLIEYSAKDGKMFCIAEFDGVRIMGTIDNDQAPAAGQKIKVSSCGFDGSPKFTFVPA